MRKITAKEKKGRPGLFEAKGIDPYGRRKSFYGQTEAEAIRKATASYGHVADDTLYGFYCAVYLPTIQHRSDAWKEQVRWAMDGYILPAFGNASLSEITRAQTQRFFNRLSAGSLMATSISKIKIVLSGVLNLAEADEVIPRNPARSVRLPEAEPTPKKSLTPEQLWALLNASHGRIRPFVLLSGFAGLRRGEALGVQRNHVRNGILSVLQQVRHEKGGARVSGRLKTRQSKAEIPLPASMVEMLLNAGQVSDVWLCSDSKGGYLSPKNVTRELATACRAAGLIQVDESGKPVLGWDDLPKPLISPHELRHTFISILEHDLECPAAISAALSRKSSRAVTAGYSHSNEKVLRKWMDRYWEFVSTSRTTIQCRTDQAI